MCVCVHRLFKWALPEFLKRLWRHQRRAPRWVTGCLLQSMYWMCARLRFRPRAGGYGTGRWTGSGYITHAWIAKQHQTEDKGCVDAFVCRCCRFHRFCFSVGLLFVCAHVINIISTPRFHVFRPAPWSSLRAAGRIAWQAISEISVLSWSMCNSLTNDTVARHSPLRCHCTDDSQLIFRVYASCAIFDM